ncbi:MAG TPA: nucleotide exchange factor GrpE, partial [Candidatus Hydrogenedentes bacterium]|nr:nucleotide exchange factor GrpE [Candidatus Hydrogenedentota bacterium]
GVEPIPSHGEAFDPHVHEALAQQPSDEFPADTVMEEWQRGYRMGELLLRPSRVVVSSGPARDAADATAEATEEQQSET